MTSLLPPGVVQFSDTNGAPLVGGTVDMFTPGTSTPKLNWKDSERLAANTAPIVLDSAGSCIIWGEGAYRQVVKDALGNLIFDATTSSSLSKNPTLTEIGVSTAMLPVVEATTLADAASMLLSGGLTHLNIAADESLTVSPSANPPATRASVNIQGDTKTELPREFLVNLGLESKTGSTANGDPQAGKVTLYSGLNATVGTGDVWTVNTCLTLNGPGNGKTSVGRGIAAQGIELDFNNFDSNRGDSGNITTDLSLPVCYGLSVTGAGTASNTSAIVIVGANSTVPQWNRGLLISGKVGIASIHDVALAPVGIQFDGIYSVAAINLTSTYGNFGANAGTALYMKNLQTITWQDNTTLHPISDTVDASNARIIGSGATSVAAAADFTAPNHRMPNSGSLTWLRTGTLSGGSPFCFDYVDSLNNRNVGFNCNSIFMGGGTHPVKNDGSLDLGTSLNYWGNIYSNVGIVAPSDLSLKDNVSPLNGMLSLVNTVNPIKFTYKATTDHKVHYGFDAQEIKDNFETHFAGVHEQEDGTKWLAKDELIAVLWKAVQELSAKVDRLMNP